MAVPDTPALTPERIEAWRRNIQDMTFANYFLSMGIAVHHQGDPAQAAALLRRGLGLAAYRDEMEIALADAQADAGDLQEAQRLLAAAAVRDPRSELRGRSGLCRVYAATPALSPATVLAQFDRALVLAQSLEAGDEESALTFRRLTFQVQAKMEVDQDAAILQALSRDFSALPSVDASAEALADLARQLGAVSDVAPDTLLEVCLLLTRMAARMPLEQRPDLAALVVQVPRLQHATALYSRLPELAESLIPLAADDHSARTFLKALADSVFHQQRDLSVPASIYLALLEHDPENLHIRLQTARSLIFLGRFDEAGRHLHAVAERTSSPAEKASAAIALLSIGRIDEAEAIATAAITKNPAEPALRLALGIVAQALGRDDQANEAAAAVSGVQDVGITVFCALQALVAGDARRAMTTLDWMIGLQPDPSAYLLFWKGLILVHAGDRAAGNAMVAAVLEQYGSVRFQQHIHAYPRAATILHDALTACGLVHGRHNG